MIVFPSHQSSPPIPAREWITAELELLYSPLDGGFYFRRTTEHGSQLSITFPTRQVALGSMHSIEWETFNGIPVEKFREIVPAPMGVYFDWLQRGPNLLMHVVLL